MFWGSMAKNSEDKSNKQKARQLWDAAREAFAHGDYRRARELDAQVTELAPESDHGRQAARELEAFRTDRLIRIAGIGAVVLYGLAWLVAFW